MQFKSREIEVVSNQPFEKDLLDREASANILTQIIINSKTGFTLSINGEWGSGKTTFIRMWQAVLEDKGIKTISFNAWETDFAKDPFLALIDGIIATVPKIELASEKQNTLNKLLISLIEIAKLVPQFATWAHIASAIQKGCILNSEATNKLKSYQSYVGLIKDFRDKLQQAVAEISPDQPIVLFVDELDRCRPDYAVELLERIKHFFSVDNIIFVLSIDKKVITQAIKGVYNNEELNADGYLRRFIDLEFNLPQSDIFGFVSTLYEYHGLDECEDAYRNYLDKNYNGRDSHSEKIQAITNCLKSTSRSFRDIEKYFNLLEITMRSLNSNRIDIDYIVWLVYMQIFVPEAYSLLKTKGKTELEMLVLLEEKLFGKYISNGKDNDAYLSFCLCLLTTGYCAEYHIDTMKKEEIESFNFQHLQTVNFSSIYYAAHNRQEQCNLNIVMKHIELIESHFQIESKAITK